MTPVAGVANELVALCRAGKFAEATDKLYAENIVSVEAFEMPAQPGGTAMPREMRGLAAVKQKGAWWEANHEVHSAKVEGPFVSMDKFAVLFTLDVTFKPNGKRHVMSEVAVYTVEGGKIVHEEFLYDTRGMGQ